MPDTPSGTTQKNGPLDTQTRRSREGKCVSRRCRQLAESVPPKLYGGTERVVSWLTEELVAMGHQVSLFASGDSITNAVLEACSPKALRLDPAHRDPMFSYGCMLARIAAAAPQFDIVHYRIDWVHIPLLQQLGVPFVTRLHGCSSQSSSDDADLKRREHRDERVRFITTPGPIWSNTAARVTNSSSSLREPAIGSRSA